MISTEEASRLLGITKITMEAWVSEGRVVGLESGRRGLRLPRWQFEPVFRTALPRLSAALGTTDGWALLSFLESPLGALNGRSPREAIEQGEIQRLILLAQADGF
jgi:excisionase family DNA binding protein